MTVAIALQVHDGVVLASDSALTLNDPNKTGPDSILNVYNNGNKIFNLCKGLPIGAAFYGAGSFGASSVPTLVKDLRQRFAGKGGRKYQKWKLNPRSYSIADVAEKAREFLFEENFKPLGVTAAGTQFGFIVAGYSSGAKLSEVWTFEIRGGQCEMPRVIIPQGLSSIYAGGDPEVFNRLINGVGSGLAAGLQAIGVPDHELQVKTEIVRTHLAMPLGPRLITSS